MRLRSILVNSANRERCVAFEKKRTIVCPLICVFILIAYNARVFVAYYQRVSEMVGWRSLSSRAYSRVLPLA